MLRVDLDRKVVHLALECYRLFFLVNLIICTTRHYMPCQLSAPLVRTNLLFEWQDLGRFVLTNETPRTRPFSSVE
jgi:hypothetical protein